jgi:hypothetical protein
MSEINQSPQN